MPRSKSIPTKYKARRSGAARRSAYSRYGKAIVGRRFPMRTSTDVPDRASMSCGGSINGGVVNQTFQIYNIGINLFARAVQVARAYQFYRITNAKLTFRPTYDTFIANGGNSKMNLYYMIDKAGAIPVGTSLAALKQMGAKPHQLDENPFVVSWAPAVLESVMIAGGAAQVNNAGAHRVSPWLTTNSGAGGPAAWNISDVDHLGITFSVEQLFANAVTTFEVDLEVQFEFMKPLWPDVEGVTSTSTVIDLTSQVQPRLLQAGGTGGGMYVGAGAGVNT